jgi:hypothetical protein
MTALESNRQINYRELANAIGVHRNTLTSYLKANNLQRRYSTISNDDLDNLVRMFKVRRPESGFRYLVGYLRNRGLKIQRRRVLGALRRIDVLGQRLRDRKAIRRRKYYVRRPNALWHVDGHHKLIRWGIVIHAFIDGYCRTASISFRPRSSG